MRSVGGRPQSPYSKGAASRTHSNLAEYPIAVAKAGLEMGEIPEENAGGTVAGVRQGTARMLRTGTTS